MPIEHIIRKGESTISLSEQHGLFAGTIWDDPANAGLRTRRPDMNELLPGDLLTIPEKRQKWVDKQTGQRHRFRRRGIPAVFRLQMFDGEKERAGQDYRLTVDGRDYTGRTDQDGVLELYLPATSKRGTLVIGPDRFTLELNFGHLGPITEMEGVQGRLSNLGYDCGEANGELNEETRAALLAFQDRFGLPLTGEPDEATRQQLEKIHDERSDFPEEEESA